MRKIFILVVVFLVLVVGVGGVYYFWQKKTSDEPGKCLISTVFGCWKMKEIKVREMTVMGIKSSNGEKIFSPIDGECKKSNVFYEDSNGKMYDLLIINGQMDGKTIKLSLIADGGLNCGNLIKKGDFLGDVSKIPMLDYQQYNLVILLTSLKERIENFDYYVPDEDLIHKLNEKIF